MIREKNNWLLGIAIGVITLLFFYPVFLKGLIPFPGDLLLAEYQPYRSYSFDGIAPGGVPNKAQYFDTIRQLYPWKTFAIEEVKKGQIPLWNPYNFSGSPLVANFQSAIYYPLNFLYFVLPQHVAWTVLIVLQPLGSLIAFYLLARKLTLSKKASLFSSISYSFSLYMTTFLEYNIMGHFMYLLPLSILSIEYIFEGRKSGYIYISLLTALLLFAGHLQLFIGALGFCLLYSSIRLFQTGRYDKKLWRVFLFIVLFCFIGIGIGSIQLFPGVELIMNSARSSHEFSFFLNNALIKPGQLILYLVPDLFGNPAVKNYLLPFSYPSKALYIGLPAILFAVLGIFSLRKKSKLIPVLTTSATVALFVFLNPISYLLYLLNLPLFSSSSPSNYIFLVSLGLCLLAGLGLDTLIKVTTKKITIMLSLLWISLFVSITILVTSAVPFSKNNLVYSVGLFAILSTIMLAGKNIRKLIPYLPFLFIIIASFDLFYFFHKFNPFVPASYIYPSTPIEKELRKMGIDRSWGYSHAGITPNLQTQMGVYSAEGYDPLYSKLYANLIQASDNGRLLDSFNDKTRSDAMIVNGFGETGLMDNPFRMKILSLTGTKYIIDKTENGSTTRTFPDELFEKVKSIGDFHVMHYKNAVPRYFMTSNFSVYKTNEEFEKIFFNSKFDPSKNILLTEDPHITSPASTNKAKLTSYKPTSVKFETESDGESLVFLSDTFYPGWNAYTDGDKQKIIRANYTYRAVVVPEGKHTVEFKYEPATFKYGLLTSVMSIIVGLFLFVYVKKKK